MLAFLNDRGLVERTTRATQATAERAAALVVHAMGFIGTPYRLGGNQVETGFDCSGFVRAVFEQTMGLVLPRRADQQAQALPPVAREALQPGDLVFFNTLRRPFSHVGIYVGQGRFVHSPRPGAEVRVESMHSSYWSLRFEGARRAPELHQATPASSADAPAAHPFGPETWSGGN